MYRVQVKYSSGKEVDLRRIHSNSQGYIVKKYTINSFDWLFVYHSSGSMFLFKEDLSERTSLSLPLLKTEDAVNGETTNFEN